MGRRQFFVAFAIVTATSTFVAAQENTVGAPLPPKQVPAAASVASPSAAAPVVAPAPAPVVQAAPTLQPAPTVKAAPTQQQQQNINMSSQLRQQRQLLEMQTEEELVLRLEKGRLEDEQARREKMFREAFQAEYGQQLMQTPQAQPAPAPVTNSTPVAVTSTSTPMAERATLAETDDDHGERNYFLALNGGALNYPAVANVNPANPATGVTFGANLPPFLGLSNLWLEAGMLYSFQQTSINRATSLTKEDVDHFGLNANLSYHWKFSDTQWFIPVTGAVFSFTHRRYNGGQNTSNAFDLGAQAGVDFVLTKGFIVGLEYRFMANLDYEKQMGPANTDVMLQQLATGRKVQNLESFGYQMVLLNAKFTF